MLVVYSDCISIEHCDYLLFVCVCSISKKEFQRFKINLSVWIFIFILTYITISTLNWRILVNS